jgi:hypothetical protein
LELIQKRKISHPSKIISATIKANRELIIVIEGFPWWRENSFAGDNDQIELLFVDVSEGELKLPDIAHDWPEWDEALEDFEVSNAAQYSWADTDGYELFCSKPLKNPLGLYATLHDYLTSEGSFHTAKHFLNFGGSDAFDLYLKYTSSRSYLLSCAPKKVTHFLAKQLEMQDVPYRMSPIKLASCGALRVRLGNSIFFCKKAVACFNG